MKKALFSRPTKNLTFIQLSNSRETNNEYKIKLTWKNGKTETSLDVNLKTCDFEINFFDHDLNLYRKLELV
jgi:hypothetical protein